MSRLYIKLPYACPIIIREKNGKGFVSLKVASVSDIARLRIIAIARIMRINQLPSAGILCRRVRMCSTSHFVIPAVCASITMSVLVARAWSKFHKRGHPLLRGAYKTSARSDPSRPYDTSVTSNRFIPVPMVNRMLLLNLHRRLGRRIRPSSVMFSCLHRR